MTANSRPAGNCRSGAATLCRLHSGSDSSQQLRVTAVKLPRAATDRSSWQGPVKTKAKLKRLSKHILSISIPCPNPCQQYQSLTALEMGWKKALSFHSGGRGGSGLGLLLHLFSAGQAQARAGRLECSRLELPPHDQPSQPPPLLFSRSGFTDNERKSLCVAKDDPSFLTATAPPQLERNNRTRGTIFPSENPKKIPACHQHPGRLSRLGFPGHRQYSPTAGPHQQ